MTTSEPIALIWVCQCCAQEDANGECCADDSHGGDGIAPWSAESGEVTAGMLAEEHADDCAVHILWQLDATGPEWATDDVECGCARRDFSWRRCDGCGSTLGGSRDAFTVWAEPTDADAGVTP